MNGKQLPQNNHFKTKFHRYKNIACPVPTLSTLHLTMKHKKKLGNPKEEECGVWLDTRELKRRKVETHSISTLLNPLSRRKHNIEVALNFTQTRVPQRCTKQTIVPSFFLSKSKGKPTNPQHTSSLRAVGAASPGSGKNITEGEKYTGQPELLIDSDFHRGSFGCYTLADQQERLPTILRTVHCSSEERDPPRGTTHSNTTLALNEQSYQVSEQRQGFCQDGAGIDIVVHEPPSPRGTAGKVSASSDVPNVHPDNLTQLGFTQDSQENRVISHRKVTRSPAVNYSLDKGTPVGEGNTEDWPFAESATLCKQSFEAGLFGPLTSTQQTVNREKGLSERKVAVHSPRKLNSDRDKDLFTENKENVFRPTVLFSTRKEMNFNRTSLKRPLLSSGAPSLLHCSNVPHGAESLAFKRLKRPCNDQSTLSLLFSQDSQGNRVISHRQTGSRNGVVFPENWNLPLGHCTNAISGGEGCTVPLNMKLPHLDVVCKSTCVAESKYDYMFCPWTDLLFTQDSEGNAVIKHS